MRLPLQLQRARGNRRSKVSCNYLFQRPISLEWARTLFILYCHTSFLPASLSGCGCQFTVRIISSSGSNRDGEEARWDWEVMDLAMRSSSGSSTIVSVESSQSNAVGEACRGAAPRASL